MRRQECVELVRQLREHRHCRELIRAQRLARRRHAAPPIEPEGSAACVGARGDARLAHLERAHVGAVLYVHYVIP